MPQREPEEILEIFDGLDLEDPEERRICLFTLNDYFGAVFAEVGEKLDFGTADYGKPIGGQWNKASSRLRMVDSVNIPGEYYSTIEAINGIRGDYAHNFRDYPPVEPIEAAREVAPRWADWLRDAAEEYEEFQESLTATESLVQIGERSLDSTLDDSVMYPPSYSDRVEVLNEQADDLQAQLETVNDDEVTKELVDVVSDILEWERDKNVLKGELENWEQEEEDRRERMDRAENTYNFVVVDEADDLDRISLVKHHIGEPDHHYTFSISNCPISTDEMEYLRGLDPDDEVMLWVGTAMHRDRNGRIRQEDIIKQVVDMEDESGTTLSAADW